MKRRFALLTAQRAHRLQRGITLAEACLMAGLSMARASEIERRPELARPGELEELRAAVERLFAHKVARDGAR